MTRRTKITAVRGRVDVSGAASRQRQMSSAIGLSVKAFNELRKAKGMMPLGDDQKAELARMRRQMRRWMERIESLALARAGVTKIK